MADAALPEIAGAALTWRPSDSVASRPFSAADSGVCRPLRRPRLMSAPRRARPAQAPARRTSSCHPLRPGRAAPHPRHRRATPWRSPAASTQSPAPNARRPSAERTCRTAGRWPRRPSFTSVMPTFLHSAAMSGGGTRRPARHHRGHAAIHVDAVVGVADRRVEIGEELGVVTDHAGELPNPGVEQRRGRRVAIQHPLRSAGVLTGWSHSRSNSSSARSSVTEQPAMSRLVM